MITLNLLPAHYKHEYAFERKKRLIIFVFVALCAITLVFNALLFSVYLYVKVWDSSVSAELEKQQGGESAKYIADLEKSVKNANKEIDALTGIQKDMTVSGPVLENMIMLIKPGVYLKNVSLNAATQDVAIGGFAKTRDLVLELEQALKTSDFVVSESVKSPVTNIFTSANINFSLTLKVKNRPE